MWIVAINAIHLALLHFMRERFRELRPGFGVTAHTLGISVFGLGRLGGRMNIVATGASHFTAAMTRAYTPHMGCLVFMTGKAGCFPCLGGHLSRITNFCGVSCFGMLGRIAVA